MAMVVKNNKAAKNTLNTVNKNANALKKSMAKLSSGMKINSAADDAASYSISEGMRVQIRSLEQDDKNAQNGISLLKVAEGGVQSTIDILKTLKEKAIDAANDTNSDIDRAVIQKEVDQAISQIDENANITFNGKTVLDGTYKVPAQTVEEVIVDALSSEWVQNSLEQIEEAYGLSFRTDGASVRDMNVKFEDDSSSSALAYVTSTFRGAVPNQKTSALSLTVNLGYYRDMDRLNVNGLSHTAGASYLDRTIVHEMTHAVMSANIKNFSALPSFVKEGAAELIHGIDDTRRGTIESITSSSSTLTTLLNQMDGSDPNTGTDNTYAAGYVYLRYLTSRSPGEPTEVMHRFMTALNETSLSGKDALNKAVADASLGVFMTHDALVNAMKTDLDNSPSNKAFLKKYCEIDLDNKDTGSILGKDAGGLESLNAEDTIREAGSARYWQHPLAKETVIEGLTCAWPDGTTGAAGNIKIHLGTKASQNITLTALDMRAQALGVMDDDGKPVSVRTRNDAVRAISRFDKAVERAVDAESTIGALQSRLAFSSRNLVTAENNVDNADSVIRDADMAKEMMEYTKNNVLMQSSQSMLAQANQNSSSVLSLLQ